MAYLVRLDREVHVEDGGVVLQDPAQRIVVLRVNPLDIPVVDRLAEELAVQTAREVGVEKASVVNGLADDATDELEERQMFWVDG